MKTAAALCCLFVLASCKQHPASAAGSVVQRDSAAPLPQKVYVNHLAPVDVSPMDVSYFPADFPLKHMQGEGGELPLARVIYSRPHKGGRALFGTLLKWGEPWRLGANEATEIELFRPCTIQNVRMAAGRYVLYCIPTPNEWTIVFNKNLFSWGLKFDGSKDVYRFVLPVEKSTDALEYFTMVFQPSPDGAQLVMAWDDVLTRLPIKFQ